VRLLIVLVLALLAAVPVRAGELTLAESARREVEDDRFTARLEGRAVAADPATAQAELNTLMADALAAVPAAAELDVQTGAYDVRPRSDDDRVERWIARQTVTLDGADRTAVVDTVATLQELGLATLGLGTRLSEASAGALRDALIREAIEALRAQAAVAAEALDQEVAGWLAVRIDGARPEPRALMAEAATARAAPPALTVGTTTVRVTVEGTAELANP
jgi:predicted secreted protein